MVSIIVEQTSLWKRTLSAEIDDEFRTYRSDLASALRVMRKSVQGIVGEIAASCESLTIHDVTHLDALWETASEIIGPVYPVNPVEAFVFGASVLLHDAALALIAYPGGEIGLRSTVEWRDMEGALRRKQAFEVRSVPLAKADVDRLTFAVLRRLHAAQAERLAVQSWPRKDGTQAHLLDSLELRQAYGKSIGKVAHSHHWDIDRVAIEMRSGLGASPDLPAMWTLSELKVACMLRCADIAHIDRRRAPTILMSGKSIDDSSKDHWSFQNRLNRPALREEALVFVSGEDFPLAQSEAWWLSYGAIREVDKEVRSSNAVLAEQGFPQFAAKRVAGADTPRALARFITTVGWKPVDTDVHVTNPVSLARTLGGANLYGNDKLAPIRELVQNGVDAVRARRRLEGRKIDWGFVRITLALKPGSDTETWLHVDDTGTGMSERMITESLLDFGTSSWNSLIVQEEFPGLESKGIDPVGKFGIGFFSIFLLGDDIEVITRKFRGGDSTKMLTFAGLERRPILREANEDEIPLDCSTRVSVRVSDVEAFTRLIEEKADVGYERSLTISPVSALKRLFSAVDVKIEYTDEIHKECFVHHPNWINIAPQQFLRSLTAGEDDNWLIEASIEAHADLLRPLLDSEGTVYGRAAINVAPTLYSSRVNILSRISVGGFITKEDNNNLGDSFYVGVLAGEARVASRAIATRTVPSTVLKNWASEQAKLLDKHRLHPHDLLPVCHSLLRLDADTLELPFCLIDKSLVSYGRFLNWLNSQDVVKLPLSLDTNDFNSTSLTTKEFKHIGLDLVARDVLFYGIKPGFICAVDADHPVLRIDPIDHETEEVEQNKTSLSIKSDNLVSGSQGVVTTILQALNKIWARPPRVEIIPERYLEINSYRKLESGWALSFFRDR